MYISVGVFFSVALPVVSGMELYNVTQNTMHARWRPTEGASGYMLVYAPLSSETIDETEVRNPLYMSVVNHTIFQTTFHTHIRYYYYKIKISDALIHRVPNSCTQNSILSEKNVLGLFLLEMFVFSNTDCFF